MDSIYLYHYTDLDGDIGVGYIPALSNLSARNKIQCVISANQLPIDSFKINQRIDMQAIREQILIDPSSEETLRHSMYKVPSNKSINHFLFGEFPEDFDTLRSLIEPPKGYTKRCIRWFNRRDMYEMSSKMKTYGLVKA